MKVVAIVCEYNPFHMGHLHQIQEIRRAFGEDTAIIAIMSGHFVQRGDLAILGKFDRAQMAVRAGVSLVLELPFPHSMAAAPYFAEAGVSIAERLSVTDALSFGSETGDIDTLQRVAERLEAPAFLAALKQNLDRKDRADVGYAALRSLVYREMYGGEAPSLPNDILAVEYLSSLRRMGSGILPHTIRRTGTDKDAQGEAAFAGATYIRESLRRGDEAALSHLPVREIWEEAKATGRAPALLSRLSTAILADLRQRPRETEGYAESEGGLYPRILTAAAHARDLDELFSLVATKKYTAARIRRAVLYAYFRISPVLLRTPPAFTAVLAMDARGRSILSRIRKTADIPILTKPADTKKLTPDARLAVERAYRADSIYALASPTPVAGDAFLAIPPKIE